MPMTSAQGIERERKRTAARMAAKRAEREAAERAAKLAAQGKAGDDLQVTEADTQGGDSQPGAAGGDRARSRNTAGLKRGALPGIIPSGSSAETVTSVTVSPGGIASRMSQYQSDAFDALGPSLVKAATYLARVASGRIKGEQWRMRASESLLDRGGVVAATIERAADRAAAADAASLAPLLARLAQAQALAARKASATDAETGQTSGTQNAD